MSYQYSIQGKLLGFDQIASAQEPFLDLSPSNQLATTAPVDLGSQPNGAASLIDSTDPDNDQSSARATGIVPSSLSSAGDDGTLTRLQAVPDAAGGDIARGSEPNNGASSVISLVGATDAVDDTDGMPLAADANA